MPFAHQVFKALVLNGMTWFSTLRYIIDIKKYQNVSPNIENPSN